MPKSIPKHSTRITSSPQPPPRQSETSWKLEFRGVVKLVRWVSRRDKRTDVVVPGDEAVLDEKQLGGERRGYSIASLGRKARDNPRIPKATTPSAPARPRPTAATQPPPKLQEEREKEVEEPREGSKRRLTKSNPVLAGFGRASSELKKRTSGELAKRASRRTSSDAASKLLTSAHSLEPAQQVSRESRRPSVDAGAGISTHGGGVFVSDAPLAIHASPMTPGALARVGPSRLPLPDSGGAFLTPVPFSAPRLRTPASVAVAPALLTQTTTITQITTTTTTTTTLATPSGITSTPFTAHNVVPIVSTTTSALPPVLEGPIVLSPPEIETAAEFPWAGIPYSHQDLAVGVAVTGGLSPVESNAISSITSLGGASVSPVVSNRVSPVEATASLASNGSLSPMSSLVSPPLSTTASPWMSPSLPMSAVTSPAMSISASPVLRSNAHLSETSHYSPHVPLTPSIDTPATSSSLSYATARSNRNSLSAQVDMAAYVGRYAATDLGHGHTIDPRFLSVSDSYFSGATDAPRFSAAATDLGHGTSSRAASPAPSDRYAFSDDPHDYRPQPGHGILRALTKADKSGAPLPMPFRPFMAGRDSSGSVTFDDSSAQSSPRIGGRRKIMTMSSSDIGHSTRTFRPQVQRSTSSLSIAGRIMRSLSIGKSQNGETEGSRLARKLTRKKSSCASSTASLTVTNAGVPPVPPLPPGIMSSKCVSESGHGDGSALGHGDGSTLGHGQWGQGSQWGGSSSVLGHSNTTTATSPAPTRSSFMTTQSAPAMSGRKLVKRRQPGQPRAVGSILLPGRTLASLDLEREVTSRDPPRITTQFVQEPLMPDDYPLTASAGGTTDDGHLMAPRPGLPRRTSSQRRWTIADMDDEEFLRQLEAKLSGAGGRLRKSRMLEEFVMGVDQNGAEPEDIQASDSDGSVAEREWVRARRAMMCVREIVRTEKSYLRHLVGFYTGEDAPGMSSILAEHLPRLIETSRVFCSGLEEDPSAWGVSKAFLGAEEQLEATLVQWSGVVGEVISSTHHKSESQAISEDGHTSSAGSGSASSSWIRRRSATANTSIQLNLMMTPVNGSNGKNKKSTRGAKTKKMTEQDVVIMPTQRAIRYVLMFRELLLHTPVTSASRPLVERALQGATRIARKCDEAQTHADHILSP